MAVKSRRNGDRKTHNPGVAHPQDRGSIGPEQYAPYTHFWDAVHENRANLTQQTTPRRRVIFDPPILHVWFLRGLRMPLKNTRDKNVIRV